MDKRKPRSEMRSDQSWQHTAVILAASSLLLGKPWDLAAICPSRTTVSCEFISRLHVGLTVVSVAVAQRLNTRLFLPKATEKSMCLHIDQPYFSGNSLAYFGLWRKTSAKIISLGSLALWRSVWTLLFSSLISSSRSLIIWMNYIFKSSLFYSRSSN